MKISYYGHACFSLAEQGVTLLFDPFLNNNPLSPVKAHQVKADYILVTHGHDDHLGDALEIAQRNKATIITTVEVAKHYQQGGVNFLPMNLGGGINLPFGRVKLTEATHGSGVPGGRACGFLLNFFGKIIYFAGDTGLFGDMRLLGELNKIDLAFLPIGDHFTMGIEDAVIATKFLETKKVIPMHYNTWPLITANPEDFQEQVQTKTDSQCLILAIGEELDI